MMHCLDQPNHVATPVFRGAYRVVLANVASLHRPVNRA